MIKNTFYFTLKALKIFNFCVELLVMLKKDKVNFKIYEFTTWEKSSCIHILPNISKNKGNQTVKFGQLVECSVKNIFLKKPYTKFNAETISKPFSEKSKLNISVDQ